MKTKFTNYHQLNLIFVIVLIIGLLITSCSSGKKKKKSPDYSPITVLKLAPSSNNPRNSEGDFITLKDGRILFVYSHYTSGSGGDHDPAFLAGRYSEDGGRTWTSEDEVIIENEGGMNVMSVSLHSFLLHFQ